MTLPNFDKAKSQGLTPFLAIHSPNIQFKHHVNHSDAVYKTVDVAISITNLLPELAAQTIHRLFSYILECVASDLNPAVIPPVIASTSTNQPDSGSETSTSQNAYLQPIIHCELDIDSQNSQGIRLPTTPGGLATSSTNTIVIVNVDILIGNLQTFLLSATFERMKIYLTNSLTADMNPAVTNHAPIIE